MIDRIHYFLANKNKQLNFNLYKICETAQVGYMSNENIGLYVNDN